jgi:nitrogen fixation NifU-like protein
MDKKPDPSQLYREVIMRHQRAPFGYEPLPGASHTLEARNPLCGDAFTLYIDWAEGRARRARFQGFGCAISKASTSLLVQLIEGRTRKEIAGLIRDLRCIAEPACEPPEQAPEELFAFLAARDYPARKTCVTLSWDRLDAFLGEVGGDRD